MVERCRAAAYASRVCGEMASRPLEAMALVGLGVHTVADARARSARSRPCCAASMPAAGRYLRGLLDLPDHSLRGRLQAYAQDHGVVLPTSVYQPF